MLTVACLFIAMLLSELLPFLQVMSEKVYDGKKVDVWSCGCTLFVMLAGVFPFLKMSEEELAPSARLRKM
jgi:serine/threonine protein kinase